MFTSTGYKVQPTEMLAVLGNYRVSRKIPHAQEWQQSPYFLSFGGLPSLPLAVHITILPEGTDRMARDGPTDEDIHFSSTESVPLSKKMDWVHSQKTYTSAWASLSRHEREVPQLVK